MSTVAILGAGELGGAIAHALAARGSVSRVLLIDPHGQVAAGKALDIQQAGAITGFHTRLEGTDRSDARRRVQRLRGRGPRRASRVRMAAGRRAGRRGALRARRRRRAAGLRRAAARSR